MKTAADAFREIDKQAIDVRRKLDEEGYTPDVPGELFVIQRLANDGLREALANQPKLAACPALFCACTKLLAEYDGCSGPSEFGDRAVAEELIEAIRDATTKALKPNTGEPT